MFPLFYYHFQLLLVNQKQTNAPSLCPPRSIKLCRDPRSKRSIRLSEPQTTKKLPKFTLSWIRMPHISEVGVDRCGIRIQLEVYFGNFLVGWGSNDWIDHLEREAFHNFIDLGGHNDGVALISHHFYYTMSIFLVSSTNLQLKSSSDLKFSDSFDSIESQSESFASIESQNVISLTNANGPSDPLKPL